MTPIGVPMAKKTDKMSPPYWRLMQILQFLSLTGQERDRGTDNHCVVVRDFGTVFRYGTGGNFSQKYQGWDVISLDINTLEENERQFKEELMWHLISKGYMAYLRGLGGSGEQKMRNLLVRYGWAEKIMNKRLEIYANQPKHNFYIDLNKGLLQVPLGRVLAHYPTFFDYLV